MLSQNTYSHKCCKCHVFAHYIKYGTKVLQADVCKLQRREPPDLDPQDGDIWPLGQVHMLGLEQKPSPHVLRQIAAKGKEMWSDNIKCQMPNEITAQCAIYSMAPGFVSIMPLLPVTILG